MLLLHYSAVKLTCLHSDGLFCKYILNQFYHDVRLMLHYIVTAIWINTSTASLVAFTRQTVCLMLWPLLTLLSMSLTSCCLGWAVKRICSRLFRNTYVRQTSVDCSLSTHWLIDTNFCRSKYLLDTIVPISPLKGTTQASKKKKKKTVLHNHSIPVERPTQRYLNQCSSDKHWVRAKSIALHKTVTIF